MSMAYRCEGGVVAWMIRGIITSDMKKLIAAIERDDEVLFVTDKEARFMAGMDLGPQWNALARQPVRFTTDQLNHICGGSKQVTVRQFAGFRA